MDPFYSVEIKGVTKRFGSFTAVDQVSLAIRHGEVFSMLGPSGCGKTTLLRMIAGFERPDEGRILLNGVDITDLPPNQRKVNTIFQNYALFPHMTVWDNIAYGLTIAKRPKAEIHSEVDRMLGLIQMEDHAYKKPSQISGGQKQRVAIARALINRPQVLLLDEPLAALDLKLRQRMLIELDNIHDEVGITFIYVTHDQGEAMSLSDTIAVMNRGQIAQTGSPKEIYEAPRSSFVAAFIGDTNFFEGRVSDVLDPEYSRMQVDGLPQPLLCFNDKKIQRDSLVYLSLRPEKFRIAATRPEVSERQNLLEGVVEDIVYLGSQTKYRIRVGEYILAVYQQHSRFLLDEKTIEWKDRVWLWWHADDGFMLENYSEQDEAIMEISGDATPG
ncbi:MAG TPA: ABC transporter ATP-binding protein [Kiritimatiellia bacterium]|nr:ABC transporter ATP-binding protein [Kiritimatiellia bacterium]